MRQRLWWRVDESPLVLQLPRRHCALQQQIHTVAGVVLVVDDVLWREGAALEVGTQSEYDVRGQILREVVVDEGVE